MANIILPKGAFEELSNGAPIEEFGMSGRVKIQVTNKHGRLIQNERVHNDIVDTTRDKFRNAILLHTWDWDGTTPTNQLAFYSRRTAYGLPNSLVGGGISWSESPPRSIIVLSRTSGGTYKATLISNANATVSGSTITFTSYFTGYAVTWHLAEIGVASSYAGSAAGVITWANQWATANITDVTLATSDTVTITWTISLSGS